MEHTIIVTLNALKFLSDFFIHWLTITPDSFSIITPTDTSPNSDYRGYNNYSFLKEGVAGIDRDTLGIKPAGMRQK